MPQKECDTIQMHRQRNNVNLGEAKKKLKRSRHSEKEALINF
jgi:hypothetical protein